MKKVAKDVWQIALMPRHSINCYTIEDFLIDTGIKNAAKKILNNHDTRTAFTSKYIHNR